MESMTLTSAYKRLLSGDARARNELIVAAMPLVALASGRFIERNFDARYLRDDLESEGYLALCGAVDALRDGRQIKSIAAYLRYSIKTALRHCVDNDSLVGSGKSTKSNRRQSGLDSKDATCIPIMDFDKESPAECHELYRICELACESERDNEIIKLRSIGLRDKQIGQKLGISQQAVFKSRSRIEDRYDAACQSLGA